MVTAWSTVKNLNWLVPPLPTCRRSVKRISANFALLCLSDIMKDTQGIPVHGRIRKPLGAFVVDAWCIQNGFWAHWPLMITGSYFGSLCEVVLWDVVSYLWIKSSKWVDSVGLRRAQGPMFFRRPVFQHRRNCRSAVSTHGYTIRIFICLALCLMSIEKLNSNQYGKDILLLQIMEK